MLGFDALGSLALGQLGRGGVTNTTMAALAGSYVVTGNAALFSVNMASAVGSYLVTGNAAELCRDFINWLPASSGQPEAWTARAAQSDPWTPKTSQDETWTESPAGINIGEACN